MMGRQYRIVDGCPCAFCPCSSVIHAVYMSTTWVARRGWPSIASCDQTTSVAGICRRLITLGRASWATQSASTPGPAVALVARRGRVAVDRRPVGRVDFERAVVQCFPMSSIIDRRARYIGPVDR